jgi:hypothetical protein
MERDEVVRVLGEHRQELGRFGVKSLALFGSVARGESRPGSDVDGDYTLERHQWLDQYTVEEIVQEIQRRRDIGQGISRDS